MKNRLFNPESLKTKTNLIHNHKIFIWILLGVISMQWSNDFMGGHIFMYQRTLLSQCSVSSYNINFVNRKNQMTWINEYQFIVICRALWHLYSVLIGNIVNEYVHVLNLFFKLFTRGCRSRWLPLICSGHRRTCRGFGYSRTSCFYWLHRGHQTPCMQSLSHSCRTQLEP